MHCYFTCNCRNIHNGTDTRKVSFTAGVNCTNTWNNTRCEGYNQYRKIKCTARFHFVWKQINLKDPHKASHFPKKSYVAEKGTYEQSWIFCKIFQSTNYHDHHYWGQWKRKPTVQNNIVCVMRSFHHWWLMFRTPSCNCLITQPRWHCKKSTQSEEQEKKACEWQF